MRFTFVLLSLIFIIGGGNADADSAFSAADEQFEVSSGTVMSPEPSFVHFRTCSCQTSYGRKGDTRPYQHRCLYHVNIQHDDGEDGLDVWAAPSVRYTGMRWYSTNPETPDETSNFEQFYDWLPNGLQFRNFTMDIEGSGMAEKNYTMMYQLGTPTSNDRMHCQFQHIHFGENPDLVTGHIFALSDYMGTINDHADNVEIEDYEAFNRPLLFMNYMAELTYLTKPLYTLSPLIVSAGNYIGGAPWNVRAANNVPPLYMSGTTKFRAANIGDLELALGPEKIPPSPIPDVVHFISSNIYNKTTGELVWPPYQLNALEDQINGRGLPIVVAFFGIMTQQTVDTLHPELLEKYDIRTDFFVDDDQGGDDQGDLSGDDDSAGNENETTEAEREEEEAPPRETMHKVLTDQCEELRYNHPNLRCILLISGGFKADSSDTPEMEIQKNETEFAKIVNTFTKFDGFIGSRTMVEGKVELPNKRFVIQTLPRAQNVARIEFERPFWLPRHTDHLNLSLVPFGIPEDVDPNDMSNQWVMIWKGWMNRHVADAAAASPNTPLGIFQGSIPVAQDPSKPSTSYTHESPIATLLADALADRSQSDIVLLEGNIASYGLEGTGDENVLTQRHLEQLLFRPETDLVRLQVTPAQLWEILQQQWHPITKEFRPLATSGLRLGYDRRRPLGSQLTSVELNGTPLSPDDSVTKFTLGVSDYLRAGALGHTVIQNLPMAERSTASTLGALRGLVGMTAHSGDETNVLKLFADYVSENPVSAPGTRWMNTTTVVPRDASIAVSFPSDPPTSADVPFTFNLHFTAKDKELNGPFNLYRKDTGEMSGQIANIYTDKASAIPVTIFLSPVSQLVTFYMTDSHWVDQSYDIDLAFAVSVPGLATDEGSSEHDSSSSTTTSKPTGPEPSGATSHLLMITLLAVSTPFFL